MKEIESFTAVATVLNSERVVRWSSLDGLTIDGLTRADAVAVMRLVESVSERAREQAQATPPPLAAPVETEPRVAQSAQSPASSTPKTPDPDPTSESTSAKAPSRLSPSPEQDQAVYIPAKKNSSETGAQAASSSAQKQTIGHPESRLLPPQPGIPDKAPSRPSPASEPQGAGYIPAKKNSSETGAQAASSSAQKRAPRKRVPRRDIDVTPAAPDPAPPWETPKLGDTIDGATVGAVKPTVEGGAVVTLTDGTRIKFDPKGNEVNRIVPEAKTQPPTDAAPPPPSNTTPPDDVMKTRMTRDVLKWVMDQGVTEREQIIAECERLKTNGAVAFSTCPDVRQRASTVLTAMGVA